MKRRRVRARARAPGVYPCLSKLPSGRSMEVEGRFLRGKRNQQERKAERRGGSIPTGTYIEKSLFLDLDLPLISDIPHLLSAADPDPTPRSFSQYSI